MSCLRTTLINVTNAKRVIQSILGAAAFDVRFEDPTLLSLMEHHPDKDKVKDIVYFMKKREGVYNTPALYIKTITNEHTTVSWITCIDSLFGKYDARDNKIKDVKSAFRFVTYDDKHKEFVGAHTERGVGTCGNCGVLCGIGREMKLHVDHHMIPYIDIFNAFVVDNRIDLFSTSIKKEGINYYLEDASLAEKWLSYHNERATYRILCASCNTRFGRNSV